MEEKAIVPENVTGSATDITESSSFTSESDALNAFAEAKKRLNDINNWNSLCGTVTSIFTLTDQGAKQKTKKPQVGDYIKIDIPAPGPSSGDGYDWVRIEEILEEEQIFAIKVRPVCSPENKDSSVAHFFKDSATSSFIIRKEGLSVFAEVHGRNEVPNTDTEKTTDKIRNAAVGGSAIAGFSSFQWKQLVKGLLGK